jgi:hypothetical protein
MLFYISLLTINSSIAFGTVWRQGQGLSQQVCYYVRIGSGNAHARNEKAVKAVTLKKAHQAPLSPKMLLAAKNAFFDRGCVK